MGRAGPCLLFVAGSLPREPGPAWPDGAGGPLPPVCGRVPAQGTRACVARWGGLALPPVCGRSLPREPDLPFTDLDPGGV